MNQINKQMVTKQIHQKAMDLGFVSFGISKAGFMEEEAQRLDKWLNQHYHGEMSYLENHFDKRVDPSLLVPGAKSVISLAYNYFHSEKQKDASAPKISMYAYGKDYHKVVRKKLNTLFEYIKTLCGSVEGRVFVDSAPVLERDWAKRSGLGWIGKNTMLINPKKGSFFFLGEIIIDLELEYDHPIKDYCGTCTKCIEACPTEAIHPEGYIMDGQKCISYLTIELKSAIPETFHDSMDGWMFGCDICQQVCPWNRFSEEHEETLFLPDPTLLNMTKQDWENLTEDVFETLFQGSAVKRTKYSGLKRNIQFVTGYKP
jgi:epoxyqueuosine reductase